jgi:hypothetical protein
LDDRCCFLDRVFHFFGMARSQLSLSWNLVDDLDLEPGAALDRLHGQMPFAPHLIAITRLEAYGTITKQRLGFNQTRMKSRTDRRVSRAHFLLRQFSKKYFITIISLDSRCRERATYAEKAL